MFMWFHGGGVGHKATQDWDMFLQSDQHKPNEDEELVELDDVVEKWDLTHVLDINIVVVYLLTYISQSADYLRVRSSLVPSVACQITEGKYLLLTTFLLTDTL